MSAEMNRFCLYCSKTIKVGRSDKKFCDAGCKDAYYNKVRRAEISEIGRIDRMLKRNRRILKTLFESGGRAKIFGREELLKQGFEFGFQTHAGINENGSGQMIFCYDYGYRESADGNYEIFQSNFQEI